jgi:hypothetical protein
MTESAEAEADSGHHRQTWKERIRVTHRPIAIAAIGPIFADWSSRPIARPQRLTTCGRPYLAVIAAQGQRPTDEGLIIAALAPMS